MKRDDVSENQIDTGILCTVMLCEHHAVTADPILLQHQFGNAPFSAETILRAAKGFGLKARVVRYATHRLDRAPFPVIAQDRAGNFFIVIKVDTSTPEECVLILRPGEAAPSFVPMAEFEGNWCGELILFTSASSLAREVSQFDFTWFIPSVIKYRKALGEVLVISLVLQIIALVTPFFFQVVMDKVLVNHAMSTLNVIAIALLVSNLFEAILSCIRSLSFAKTGSKVDAELGSRIFSHLLHLPLSYFQTRRVGDSVARVKELENIRSFLTSNAITLILDIIFSFVFIGVMLWYSVKLTFIVLASIPIYFALSFFFTPILRKKLDEKFNRGAENQSFLVETLSGINTVKSMAVEPRWQQLWDKQLVSYVSSALSANNVSNVAGTGINLVSKLVTTAIMWFGASLVSDNKLTVGELVAFNMLSGHVSGPILRLAQFWNDFQQVGISMRRLGDILNARIETIGQKTRLPRINGAIGFQNVVFKYNPLAPEVIRNLSVHIHPGEVIGIVGRSGSGKSTLSQLIQRMYVPDRGCVSIDDQDISMIDTASLRQQIGVVLQENTLFRRSVRENIALSNPGYSIERIIEAARLAGAHEFICQLPEGYDTQVGENGVGLSGGQRQRIAIARALISDPRILIFDEATSALDYESEKIIQNNMRRICANRTVIIIAHRLSAVRDANRILVMERGEIVETGSHDELLLNRAGIYHHLYSLQSDLAESEEKAV